MNVPRIVVGTDGSPAGIATVRWAATEAWLRDAELSVLAYPERVPGDRRSVGTLVHAAMADARTIAPHIATRGEPVAGDPATRRPHCSARSARPRCTSPTARS